MNQPGRTQWEGFTTATRAAAAGGITTIVDMPLNCFPVTTTPEALAQKQRSPAGCCMVDVASWGGVIPGNQDQFGPLLQAGALGFKGFLVPSGIDEFPAVTASGLAPAMAALAGHDAVHLVHAKLPGPSSERCSAGQ
ncbi:MAG: hypothetical protein HY337_07825 [Gemmatimonadetes bacterium]|nr:hypothetical protein [Gemmatimonadota bacterium]